MDGGRGPCCLFCLRFMWVIWYMALVHLVTFRKWLILFFFQICQGKPAGAKNNVNPGNIASILILKGTNTHHNGLNGSKTFKLE